MRIRWLGGINYDLRRGCFDLFKRGDSVGERNGQEPYLRNCHSPVPLSLHPPPHVFRRHLLPGNYVHCLNCTLSKFKENTLKLKPNNFSRRESKLTKFIGYGETRAPSFPISGLWGNNLQV